MEIKIKNLSKYYYSGGKTIKALDNVSVSIPANQIFTLLGPSGCGKTTLLRCIVGLEAPDAGEIEIGDDVVVIGRQGNQEVTADDLAATLGTINYEVVTAIASRVPRRAVGGDLRATSKAC